MGTVGLIVWFHDHPEFLQSDVISNIVDALYTEQASVAGATWSPWINEKIDVSHISDAKVKQATCKALCYFRIHICYLYVLESNYCYLGDPDVKNTVASSSNTQNVYRRDGKELREVQSMISCSNTSHISGKFLINVGSGDWSNYGKYVELFAVGSQSTLSGCGSPQQFPFDISWQAVGYMNDGTVLSCGGYDPQ